MPITVILADDHAIIRNGLAPLLDADQGVELLGEAANGKEAWELIALGNSSKEIGRIMGISPRTVDTYRNRLMQKLGLNSLANAFSMAHIDFAGALRPLGRHLLFGWRVLARLVPTDPRTCRAQAWML